MPGGSIARSLGAVRCIFHFLIFFPDRALGTEAGRGGGFKGIIFFTAKQNWQNYFRPIFYIKNHLFTDKRWTTSNKKQTVIKNTGQCSCDMQLSHPLQD